MKKSPTTGDYREVGISHRRKLKAVKTQKISLQTEGEKAARLFLAGFRVIVCGRTVERERETGILKLRS